MREAFVSISRSRVRTTFSLLDLDLGDVHVKAAHDTGGDTYAVKIASAVRTNRQRSLPIGNGGILICSAITGEPRAFRADEHYLTDARTAAAGALATDLLAAADATTLTVLGAGRQARLQTSTLARLRPLQQVTVWARRSTAAERLADELRAMLGNVVVETATTVREAVFSSEIVITTTASSEPLIERDWLRPGQHLTALGADDDRKRELDSDCFARADRVVVDSCTQTCATAELATALRDGVIALDGVVELGEVILGDKPSRTRPEDVTIVKLTGVAAQDLAAAHVVLNRLDAAMKAQLYLCDVFAERPLSGNSRSVVLHDEPLELRLMQALTRELRQFETVFLRPTHDPRRFETHVFDRTRQLDFAGHPLLGAAAVLHDVLGDTEDESWLLQINSRDVPLRSQRNGQGALRVSMDQGTPTFGATADAAETERALAAFSVTPANLAPGLAPVVVSTGLRCLVVAISSGLAEARVVHPQLGRLLAELGAEFAYLLDVPTREGRHWENDGSLEDIATGSAAGAVGAFWVASSLAQTDTTIVLRQGRFLGRPSEMHVRVRGDAGAISSVEVAGPVAILAHGLLRLPAPARPSASIRRKPSQDA